MTDLVRRYALALSLVPDPDAAGDLFMDAPGEAALRRRAAAWRRRHGFPPLVEPAELPTLTEEQLEHAQYLAERGARRRQVRAVGALGGVATLALACLLLLMRVYATSTAAPRVSLDALDRLHSTKTVAGPVKLDKLTFAVQEAKATDGRIDLWWTVSGVSAFAKDQVRPPAVGVTGGGWVRAAQTEELASAGGKHLWHSSYRIFNATVWAAEVRFEQGDLTSSVRVDLARVAQDPEARRVYEDPLPLEPSPEVLQGQKVNQVIVAPTYTRVMVSPWDGGPVPTVQTGGLELKPLTGVIANPSGTFIFYEPPPANARSLTLTLLQPFLLRSTVQLEVPGSWSGIAIRQEGDKLIPTPNDRPEGSLMLPGYAVIDGRKYELADATVLTNPGGPVAFLQQAFSIVGAPGVGAVDSVVLTWFHFANPDPLTISLH